MTNYFNLKKLTNTNITIIVSLFFMLLPGYSYSQEWQSKIVYYNNQNRIVYIADSNKNLIPDFSYAGYKNSDSDIPFVPAVKTLSPLAGDNTMHIQNALDELANLPADLNGIRGALLLNAGIYRVYGTIRIKESGIVLRGQGDGTDSLFNTIIKGIGDTPHQRTIIIAGGGELTRWNNEISGTKSFVKADYIPVGSRKIPVENPTIYKTGDNIIINHPVSDAWIKAVEGGGTATDANWTINDGLNIIYNRNIVNIIGDTLIIDAPVFNCLDKKLSPAYLYKYSRAGIKTNIGIENLRIDIEADGITTDSKGNENHAWHCIELKQIEDAWVKNCTMLHFGQSGIMTSTATRITIDSCKAIDPVSNITGERRYNFNLYHASQLVLVKNSYTRFGRHDYVSNGTSTVSGCVFVNCTSENTYSSSEGHRWWTQGLLFDNIKFKSPNSSFVLALYNRGSEGTSHGWAAVNSVAWRCDVESNKSIIIQKPPVGQNYAIGCTAGKITGLKSLGAPYNQPQGYIEGTNNKLLKPNSLFYAQLEDRKNITSVKREPNIKTGTDSFIDIKSYPNPFNGNATINYKIYPKIDNNSYYSVSVKVFDLLGKEVATLVNEWQKSGQYTTTFNSRNLPSGQYYLVLRSDNSMISKKILLIK